MNSNDDVRKKVETCVKIYSSDYKQFNDLQNKYYTVY